MYGLRTSVHEIQQKQTQTRACTYLNVFPNDGSWNAGLSTLRRLAKAWERGLERSWGPRIRWRRLGTRAYHLTISTKTPPFPGHWVKGDAWGHSSWKRREGDRNCRKYLGDLQRPVAKKNDLWMSRFATTFEMGHFTKVVDSVFGCGGRAGCSSSCRWMIRASNNA